MPDIFILSYKEKLTHVPATSEESLKQSALQLQIQTKPTKTEIEDSEGAMSCDDLKRWLRPGSLQLPRGSCRPTRLCNPKNYLTTPPSTGCLVLQHCSALHAHHYALPTPRRALRRPARHTARCACPKTTPPSCKCPCLESSLSCFHQRRQECSRLQRRMRRDARRGGPNPANLPSIESGRGATCRTNSLPSATVLCVRGPNRCRRLNDPSRSP
eukprot:33575_6